MRRHALLAAIGLLAAGILAPATGEARSGPSPDEIIKSLTPTGPSGATRGLRIGPAAPGQAQPPAPQPAISLSDQALVRLPVPHRGPHRHSRHPTNTTKNYRLGPATKQVRRLTVTLRPLLSSPRKRG